MDLEQYLVGFGLKYAMSQWVRLAQSLACAISKLPRASSMTVHSRLLANLKTSLGANMRCDNAISSRSKARTNAPVSARATLCFGQFTQHARASAVMWAMTIGSSPCSCAEFAEGLHVLGYRPGSISKPRARHREQDAADNCQRGELLSRLPWWQASVPDMLIPASFPGARWTYFSSNEGIAQLELGTG